MTHSSNGDLLDVVRETAEGYDVFGELGRQSDDDVWFLARKVNDTVLVALRLQRTGVDDAGEPVYALEVARELSEHVSMEQGICASCHARLRSFAAFCSKCGADQTKERGTTTSASDKQALLASVREAASSHYAVLGEMPWSGAGSVYFAVEKSTGLLVRLRLRDTEGGFELKETKVGMTLAGAVTATYTTSPVARSSRPVAQPRPRAPARPPAAPPAATPAPPQQPAISDARYRTLLYVTIGLGVVAVVLVVLLLVR